MTTAAVAFYDTLGGEKMTAPPSQTPLFPPQTPPLPPNTPPLCGGGSVCEGICPLLTVRHLKSSGLLALQMDTKLIHQRIVFGSIKGLEYVPVQIEMAQFFVENFEMFLPPEIHPKSVRFEGGRVISSSSAASLCGT